MPSIERKKREHRQCTRDCKRIKMHEHGHRKQGRVFTGLWKTRVTDTRASKMAQKLRPWSSAETYQPYGDGLGLAMLSHSYVYFVACKKSIRSHIFGINIDEFAHCIRRILHSATYAADPPPERRHQSSVTSFCASSHPKRGAR